LKKNAEIYLFFPLKVKIRFMKRYYSLFCFLILAFYASAQVKNEISILFWNLENHFHPENDSLKQDDEFTPEGERYYGFNRYWSRNARLWKTIISAGSPEPPGIIALAELENLQVINDLFIYSPPGIYAYEVIHEDSDDWRGIDVALLFNPAMLKLVYSHFITIDMESLGGSPTRNILYSRFAIEEDTLDIFVNHWPSKYGGVGVTDKFRNLAAKCLLKAIDTIRIHRPNAKIVALGDFNDVAGSTSIDLLTSDSSLKRLELSSEQVAGTIKYQGRWEYIDHFFISKNLMKDSRGLAFIQTEIYSPEFLLETDQKYGGYKPFRTWIGYKYQEGFSDHLPIILTLKI
jgi:endonuclease/exonuclease/phosphatase family metal-dependent hydrolase